MGQSPGTDNTKLKVHHTLTNPKLLFAWRWRRRSWVQETPLRAHSRWQQLSVPAKRPETAFSARSHRQASNVLCGTPPPTRVYPFSCLSVRQRRMTPLYERGGSSNGKTDC